MANIPALFLPLAVGAATLSAADWPRLGGPNGSYVSPETGLARAWPTNGPRVVWTAEVGKGFAGPAVRNGRVYLLDRPDNQQDLLRCFSLADGREIWRLFFDAPGSLQFNGSRNVPTLDEQYLFAVGPFGQFHCVALNLQAPIWSKHLVNDFKDPAIDRAEAPTNRLDELARAQVPTWGMTQAPLLYQDLVIVAPQTKKVGLVAYEKSNGTIRWQSGYIGRNWYSHVSPTLMRFGGVDQVVMLAQPSDPEKSPAKAPPAIVSGTEAATGRILWRIETPAPHKIPIAQPVQIGDDRLFITGGYGLGTVMLQVARANNNWQAKMLLRTNTAAGHIHSPVLYRDHIFVSSIKEQGGRQTGLVCLDLDGQLRWQTGPDLQWNDGGLLFADGLALAMNGKSGRLHLLEISGDACKPLAAADVVQGPQVWAPMAFSDGRLLVRDERQLKCLDLRQP